MADHEPPGTVVLNRDGYLIVAVGDGAVVTCPTGDLEWRLRYGDHPHMIAAGVVETMRHLVMECSKEEAWRRIRLMRHAMKNTADTY